MWPVLSCSFIGFKLRLQFSAEQVLKIASWGRKRGRGRKGKREGMEDTTALVYRELVTFYPPQHTYTHTFNPSHFHSSSLHIHNSVSPPWFHLSHPESPNPFFTPLLLPPPTYSLSLSFAHGLAYTLPPSWGRSWNCSGNTKKQDKEEKSSVGTSFKNVQENKSE